MWLPSSADDAPTDYVEHRAAEHSVVRGAMFVDVGHPEAMSLACDEPGLHEVAVAGRFARRPCLRCKQLS